jgi:hypothetical protein
MRGTRIEKEEEICATNLANKTKCISTNAKRATNCMKRYGCKICDKPVIIRKELQN